MFTDGFYDQFNKKLDKKYMIKNFKMLLISIADKSMNEQHELLQNNFKEWKGDYKQIDDVLIMGIKI